RSVILSFIKATWTILLSSTRPNRIMIVVLIISKSIFWAVPHFIRVLPVMNSGPVMTSMGKLLSLAIGEAGLLTIQPVVIPCALHVFNVSKTKGVVPLAEIPITRSFWLIFWVLSSVHPA